MEQMWKLTCFVVLIVAFLGGINGQRRGRVRPCSLPNAQTGVCLPIESCAHARRQLTRYQRPPFCRFRGRYAVVCCPKGHPESIVLPDNISEQKCEEYKRTSVITTTSRPVFVPAVVGGINSGVKEFPHMAALGYGDESDIQWLCGGSLISKHFVLTAAHCLSSSELGDVQYVRLGDLNLASDTDDAKPQQFRVVKRIPYPEYTLLTQYNDIALLRLDKDVEFTEYVKPACLQVSDDLSSTEPIATGWGTVEFGGATSDVLQKVYLQYFSGDQCRQTYTPQRRLENGIVDEMQLCAGGVNEEKDTCQGDSGGPLQIKTSSNPLTYYIVGITSFGDSCGIANIPGVYTRVSTYVSWIEQIVWPE